MMKLTTCLTFIYTFRYNKNQCGNFTANNPNAMQKSKAIVIVSLAAVLVIVVIGAFYFSKANNTSSMENGQFKIEGPAIGGQRDEHGCLTAAGYSWCDAKKKCIRQWEEYCTAAAPNKVTFICSESKTITATFYPADDKYVDLQLSDGRNMTVPRAVSASGARYAKPDETFVFWNKGDTAFITEGANSAETYSRCILEK